MEYKKEHKLTNINLSTLLSKIKLLDRTPHYKTSLVIENLLISSEKMLNLTAIFPTMLFCIFLRNPFCKINVEESLKNV